MLERHNNGKKIGVEQLFRDFSKLTVAAGEKITMNYLTSAASIFNKFFASNVLKDTAFPSQVCQACSLSLSGVSILCDTVMSSSHCQPPPHQPVFANVLNLSGRRWPSWPMSFSGRGLR